MKFTIPLLSLLTVTSTLSYSLKSHIEKRDDYEDFMSSLKSTGDELSKIKDEIENNEELKNKIKNEIEKKFNATSTNNNNNNNNSSSSSGNGFDGLTSDLSDLVSNFNTTTTTDSNAGSFAECKKVVKEYYACLPKELNSSNYDESCNAFNSENCKTLFSTKLSSYEACKGVSDNFQNIVDYVAGIMDINCAKDENGKYCPISTFSQSDKSGKELTDDIIRENCHSKICREKAIEGIIAMKNMTENIFSITESFKINKMKREFDGIARADEMLAILNDEKCTVQAEANHANTLKLSSSIVLSLVLFLFLF